MHQPGPARRHAKSAQDRQASWIIAGAATTCYGEFKADRVVRCDMRSRWTRRVPFSCAMGLALLVTQVALAQFLGDLELRPFVVGLIPVVGMGGVGGVSIDTSGVLARSDVE